MLASKSMNQLQRLLLSARRLSSSQIIPPSCLLHQRLFSTSDTDSSAASFSSSHPKMQTLEGKASNKSRSTSSTTTSLNEDELAKFSAIADTWFVSFALKFVHSYSAFNLKEKEFHFYETIKSWML